MRSTNVLNVERHGDFGGTKVAMGIDANSMAHIMSVLTDLYSNPRRAVIREYSTNARDSHIDAGVDRPIEVTLPNSWNPFFKIKDFGLGLSVEEVHKVYSQYGASTKRNSDLVNGMLGLGCKSALTYTSQFTIVSVKDGVKITVVVSRIEDGSAGMEIVSEVETTEPNGVEITVPVKNGDAQAFAKESADFYQYWEPGTVLVNNEKPAHHGLKMVTPNIGIKEGNGTTDYVVMGNVAYPVKDKGLYIHDRPYSNAFSVVAFVDIGEVTFTPSRESLMYTQLTNDTLERLRKEFLDNLHKQILADIDAAVDHSQAYTVRETWSNRIGNAAMPKGITYKGESFPAQWNLTYTLFNRNYGRGSVSVYTHPMQVAHQNARKSMMITDYDGVKITPTHKAKIEKFKTTHGISATSHLLIKDPQGNPFGNWIKTYSWDDVKAVSLRDPNAVRVKRDPKLPVYDPATGYDDTTIPLDRTKTLLYVSPTARLDRRTVMALYKSFPGIQIFLLGENRWDKFKRENPKSDHLRAWVEKKIKSARDNLTPADLTALGIRRNSSYITYKGLDTSKLDDKELADYIAVLNGTYKSVTLEAYNAVKAAGEYIRIYDRDFPAVKDTMQKYPLLRDQSSDTLGKKHMIFYANAVYAATQNGAL